MQLDLNLLTALDALLEEGSVTGAAARLHVSVPAMSRTLGRLRRATGDQVLVRSGRGLTPTPYALAVRSEVHALLGQAQTLLTPPREVDPATLDRTFALRVHDAIATAVSPALIAAVAAQAPGVRLRFLGESVTDTDDLRQGRVDLEVGAGASALPEIVSRTVGHDRLVVIGRAGHPVLERDPGPTVAEYAAARHLTVSRRGRLHDAVDVALAGQGLSREVAAAAPTSAVALAVAARSDLLVAGPERMCAPMVAALGLRTRPVPLDLDPVPVTCSWHQRYAGDPAHTWLREHLLRLLTEVTRGR
jgi:DNA-binding transcriptional LysR family regulator